MITLLVISVFANSDFFSRHFILFSVSLRILFSLFFFSFFLFCFDLWYLIFSFFLFLLLTFSLYPSILILIFCFVLLVLLFFPFFPLIIIIFFSLFSLFILSRYWYVINKERKFHHFDHTTQTNIIYIQNIIINIPYAFCRLDEEIISRRKHNI